MKVRIFREDDSVIVKVGDKWKIKGKKVKYWNANFKTKKDAQAALRAYWANKNKSEILEYFKDDNGTAFLRDVVSYLKSIFGVLVYFDRITDLKSDLIYKGQQIAELEYDENKEKIIVTPYDKFYQQRWFYDVDNYDIKQYLADLILGDVEV